MKVLQQSFFCSFCFFQRLRILILRAVLQNISRLTIQNIAYRGQSGGTAPPDRINVCALYRVSGRKLLDDFARGVFS